MAASEPTLDQRRARHAWAAVQKIKNQREGMKEYGREAKKLPIRILNSGLGAALAFLCAKAKGEKIALTQLHEDLGSWVLKGRGIKSCNPENLLNSIVRGDGVFLRMATDEALAYLQWLNRFVEAEGLAGDEEA